MVPAPWMSIALTAPPQSHPPGPSFHDAVQRLMARLGWKVHDVGSDGATMVPLASLSVRMAYRMLIQDTIDTRIQRWKLFIADACGVDVAEVDDTRVRSLKNLLGALWRRVKWSNNRKVLFWQLTINGLPTAARHGTGGTCYCTSQGHLCPDRKHHFWHCPAATSIVEELCRCLGAVVGQLTPEHVWMMALPDQMLRGQHVAAAGAVGCSVRRVVREVWMVVCLAALQAMWVTAKKIMGPDIRVVLAGQPRGLHAVVCDGAVAQFWELLHEFAQSARVPGSWRRLLPVDTPFLHFPHVDRRVQVNNDAPGVVVGMPADAALHAAPP